MPRRFRLRTVLISAVRRISGTVSAGISFVKYSFEYSLHRGPASSPPRARFARADRHSA